MQKLFLKNLVQIAIPKLLKLQNYEIGLKDWFLEKHSAQILYSHYDCDLESCEHDEKTHQLINIEHRNRSKTDATLMNLRYVLHDRDNQNVHESK